MTKEHEPPIRIKFFTGFLKDDKVKSLLHSRFYMHKEEIAYLIIAIYLHPLTLEYREHLSNIDIPSLKVWGGNPWKSWRQNRNPYLFKPLRELILVLHKEMLSMLDLYCWVVLDNKIEEISVNDDEEEFFIDLFETNYPFRASFDELLIDFTKWKDTFINDL